MVVGILGGGQLARMLALAGHPLGLKFITLEPAKDACSAAVTEQLLGAYDDERLLSELADKADVVTFEFENIPADSVTLLSNKIPCYPPAKALAVTQDRLNEKRIFNHLNIPTAPYNRVNTLDDLEQAMESLGFPAILKTRREGYDGKGQARLDSAADIPKGWQAIAGKPAIVEGFVPFDREFSIIAVRSRTGETSCYPLTENNHKKGVLHTSIIRQNDPLQALAERHVNKLLNEMNYVGVLALELFQVGDHLLANEFAPRVHNSGHWTQDGAVCCQFENHLRAVCGLPLGSTRPLGHIAMLNIIGELPNINSILSLPDVHLHLYDKAARDGRKIGHINLCCEDKLHFDQQFEALQSQL
ncbi:MAG: 5-(carboxyamino)imidazole ribonucleotide synthase [Gammaproteobacteria bacterium]|nr:5-(carboxyamino)imidazole ribonucleotide synthase [Gammaproteobacteria bacterium]MCF6230459.1 5-(carboxyamino)imidazole ribonucleotide synthase [Gammaproteobacteria bacterium]